MATFKFTGEEQVEFKVIPEGDYRFETISREMGIHATNSEVNGFEYADIKFKFSDANGKPVAIWTETFTFHPKTERFFGYYLIAANFTVGGKRPPVDYEMDPATIDIIGLCGWCKVGIRKYKNKAGQEREINCVSVWYGDRPKLPRVAVKPATKIDDADLPPRNQNVEIPDDLR